MKKATEKFGEILEIHLERERFTKAALGRKIHYSADQIHKWVNQSNRIPYDAVQKLCRTLNLSPEEQIEFYREAGYPLPEWVLNSKGRLENEVADQTPKPFFYRMTTISDYMKYHTHCLEETKHHMDDLTWGIDLPNFTEQDEIAYNEYLASIQTQCNRGVIYREIMTFTDPHYVDRARMLLKQDVITYNLRYYEVEDLGNIPPLMHFWIRDSEQIGFAFYRWPHLDPMGEKRLSTNQPEMVDLFEDYFDTIWQAAKRVKDGTTTNWDVFEDIQRRYG